MITKEQIKNLKPGAPLIINATLVRVDNDGDIWCDCNDDIHYFFPRSVSLLPEKPKYDPTRLFKKGDKARMVAWNGRVPMTFGDGFQEGERPPVTPEVIVVENEGESMFGLVKIQAEDGGQLGYTCPCYLELVTPVEELEPYILEEETAFADDEPCGIIHIYYNYNGGRDKVRTFYENGPESWNATKAAAEAERDRLNDEYRKEQI